MSDRVGYLYCNERQARYVTPYPPDSRLMSLVPCSPWITAKTTSRDQGQENAIALSVQRLLIISFQMFLYPLESITLVTGPTRPILAGGGTSARPQSVHMCFSQMLEILSVYNYPKSLGSGHHPARTHVDFSTLLLISLRPKCIS